MNMTKLLKALYALSDIDSNDILDRVGLERRRGMFERTLTTIGIFGAGMVIGAGVGLLVSPVAPEDVRKKIGEGVKTVKNEINELVSHETGAVTTGATGGTLGATGTPRTTKNGATAI
jgi:hypothetical protein